ncbi:cation transporter [Adlercreutzia murintestinalis]|uniref:cation transporter n=1 Tax=Adlercreutzia murintestinalis TaxID=2941325 RepID=UPI00203BE7D9|nr:cation transporter [Adlercreutzia murintestinalis]
MKRTFKLQDLDCANCASHMEHDIAKISGVNSAKISFMTGKLMLDADDAAFERVLNEAQTICTSYEKDCVIVR